MHFIYYIAKLKGKSFHFVFLKCENFYGDIKNQYENGFCHFQFENDKNIQISIIFKLYPLRL